MSQDSLTKLSKLLVKDAFSSIEARQAGVHPSVLAYYCKKGVLERISRGFYRRADRDSKVPHEWEDAVLVARSIPRGVLCLITALVYHELTDEFARQIWIAVPRESRPPKRPNTRVVRLSNITLGANEISFGGARVKMFDQERTIIDAFRYLSKEIAIKALKKYLKRDSNHRPDLKKLARYAKTLRTDISSYVETVLT